MNAAKAKAAAKLAKGKARAEAAAKNAAAATPPATTTSSTSTPTIVSKAPSRPRPSVTQYWGDSASSSVGEGGGILRVGYDQARFEQACREVIEGILPEEEGAEKKEGEEGEAKKEVAEGEVEKKEEVVEKKKVELKKEDVALLVKEFEIPTKDAEEVLKKAGGDITRALWEATGPVPAVVAARTTMVA